jgi:hypothetical protein
MITGTFISKALCPTSPFVPTEAPINLRAKRLKLAVPWGRVQASPSQVQQRPGGEGTMR